MKRILVFISCIALLIAVLVLPASAAGIDYNDYVSDVVVDGDNDLVTVRIPASLAYMRIYDYTDKTELYEGYGGTHFVDAFIPYHEYGFQLYPFGYPWGSDGGLDQSLIPDGTAITVDFDMNVNVIDELPMEASFYILYRDSNGVSVGSAEVVYEYNGTKKTFDTNITAPDNASLIQYENDIYFVPDTSEGSFVIRDTVLTMSISSLLRQQQISGKTNKLLDEVNKQLKANGQQFDDFINGKYDPIKPDGSEVMDEYEDVEGQIRDEAQNGLNEGLDMQIAATEVLLQYLSAFAALSLIFNCFADIPFFSGLLYVSFALGTVGTLLGLGLFIADRGDSRIRRNETDKRRRISDERYVRSANRRKR